MPIGTEPRTLSQVEVDAPTVSSAVDLPPYFSTEDLVSISYDKAYVRMTIDGVRGDN
jgi:hypothetical protein